MKYRKKGRFEAFQYDGDLMDSGGNYYVPDWAVQAYKEGVLFYKEGTLYLKCLGKNLTVKVGTYVVKKETGLIYPMQPDVFEKTFEPVKEEIE